ncbi:uncharacterized protein Bfra_011770 [Botrytis fragariae]|uniref:Uncharacterized protein n=1 Tax=Botrytis fragariae TaxID=1964551 RepID=A0A8H6AKD6_9HELO|nr:uncharacterized protein Bfra_011770 [Botrytis fragariae]KAF5869227.1 hypothetical protein Bfra_011770 [Botrytis fragariae]
MSNSNFLLDPFLLQEDERNKNISNFPQTASSIMPETPFIEQKVPFIKQEQEEERVYHPVSTQLGNTPGLKYEDDDKSGSYSSLSAEEYDIRNDNSDHLSSSWPSDHPRPSSPKAGLQTGESESLGICPPSTGLQPASSDSNRPSDDFHYDTGDISQVQPCQYRLTHDQSPGGQSLPTQHYSSQAFNSPPISQAPEPGPDLDEYPDLQPGVIIMNLPTPATTQEVSYLDSWIPRNKTDIENFYAARPGLNRSILENSSKQDQVDTVMRHMLAEHGAIIDERQSIYGRYDQLGAVLIGQFRLQNPEHACELQCQGYLAFPSSAITQALSYPSRAPNSGIRNYDNQPTHNNYEEIGSPDIEAVKKWGGIRKQTNNKGVYHEVLHRRRTTIGAKCHPEAKRMMALPYSTGENLTDRDILQLARLSPLDRHLRASKFFNERGEFYTRHIRFTEMSDARLRREGLLRSWIPRKAGDRPHNSIERAERAMQLGLTGDDKLFADAAAERLRRAKPEQKMIKPKPV